LVDFAVSAASRYDGGGEQNMKFFARVQDKPLLG
jgi:hypothetical protein